MILMSSHTPMRLLSVAVASAFLSSICFAETIELVTYYPAPRDGNIFDRLHASRITVGNAYDPTNVADAAVPDGTLLISGRLGIGTTNPGSPLTAVNAAGTAVFQLAGANNAPAGMRAITLGYGGTYNGTAMGEAGYLQVEHQGVAYRPLLLNPLGGNVGVGTTTPSMPLEVANLGAAGTGIAVSGGAPSIYLAQTSGTNPNAGNPAQPRNAAIGFSTFNGAYGGGSGDMNLITQTRNAGDTSGINFMTASDNAGGYTRRMTITRNGDVGIGTPTPAARFAVYNPGNSAMALVRSDGASNALWQYNGGISRIGTLAGDHFALMSGGTDRLYVWNNGYVGIGVAPPTTPLDVNGSITNRGNRTYVVGVDGAGYHWFVPGFSDAVAALGFNLPGGRIETGNAWSFHVPNGQAYKPGGGSWLASSDFRLKKNIHPLTGALDRLLKLDGVTFEWKDPASQGNLTGTQIGWIGQQVQKVFPEWVGEDHDGYKTVGVRGFEALTVEALRELVQKDNQSQREIEGLRLENDQLKQNIKDLKRQMDKFAAPRK